MNKSILSFVVVSLVVLCAASVLADGETDDEIRSQLVMACLVEDDHPGAFVNVEQGMYDAAFQAAGSNRVRFASIMCDLAHTNYLRIAKMMVAELGDYGTPTQLPFLYSQVGNTEYGVHAVRSILKIEGITSNSVAMVDGYLSNTNNTNRDRYYVCSDLVVKAFAPDVSADLRSSASRVYFRFMKDDNIFNDWLDGTMKSVDPTYVHSKRRLAVMRAARVRTTDLEDLNYITNAINELVAYPESELPE